MPKLSDGSEPELHSLYTLEICVWFVRGALASRRVPCDIKNVDINVEIAEGALQSDY